MKIIQKLSELISEELDDAENYVMLANEYKAKNLPVAQLFSRLSNEEMNHMTLLHNMVETVIQDYRKTNGDPPEMMMAVYDYLHQKQIKHAAEVKSLQAMFSE